MLKLKNQLSRGLAFVRYPLSAYLLNPFQPVSGNPFNYPIALVAPDDDCRPQIPATLDLNSSIVYRHLRKV